MFDKKVSKHLDRLLALYKMGVASDNVFELLCSNEELVEEITENTEIAEKTVDSLFKLNVRFVNNELSVTRDKNRVFGNYLRLDTGTDTNITSCSQTKNFRLLYAICKVVTIKLMCGCNKDNSLIKLIDSLPTPLASYGDYCIRGGYCDFGIFNSMDVKIPKVMYC